MIRDQILKDHFNMIYGWGKLGLDPDKNDLYNSPAYKRSLQEVSLIPELEQAEEENKSDLVEYWIKNQIPF